VLAAIPGVIDLFGSIPPDSTARRRGYFHGGLNVLALLLFAYLAFRRGSALDRPDNTVLLLELLGVVGIMVSGWLGATLVYRNQIGVDHRYANAGKWKERELESWDKPAMNPSELADGQMMLVKVDGKRIAIARCGDGVAAFSDHCTHRLHRAVSLARLAIRHPHWTRGFRALGSPDRNLRDRDPQRGGVPPADRLSAPAKDRRRSPH
jgi:hypothetical protein